MRQRSIDVTVAILFVILSVAMTWPLARNLSRAVSDWGDPYLNACYLDWDIYAATHWSARLFDAPVFYPNRNTLAFSEHLCGIAFFAAPLRWLGAGPIAVTNILWILGFAFTGFGTYILGRTIIGSVGAGIIAGIFAAFVPWRFMQLPHLQIAVAGWLPLMIAALLHFAKERTWRNAALFGAIFFMNGWTNMHFFVFGSIAIALATPFALRRDDRAYLKIATCAIVAVVLLLPFLLPYRTAMEQYQMRRDVSETRHFSALPGDWLYVTERNRFYAPMQTNDAPLEAERLLFPGYLGVILAMLGIWYGRGTARSIGIVWTVIGYLGSLGLNGWFHTALFNALGSFRGIRVPARWAVIAYFGIAMLAALGATVIASVVERSGRPGGAPPNRPAPSTTLGMTVIAIALLFELRAAPIHWYLAPRDTPAVYTWLRTAPMRGGVAHLPFGNERDEFEYMLFETAHHRPMLNGWGFNPPSTNAIVALAQKNPIPDALMDRLEASKCSLLVVHRDRAIGARDFVQRQLARGRLVFVRHFDEGIFGDDVYAVRKMEPDAKPGVMTRTELPFGYLASTTPEIRGWACAPDGVARVILWTDQHRVAIPATLTSDAYVTGRFGMPAVSFRGEVHEDTDLEVEIISRGGRSTLLPDVSVSARSR
ncbi:MAG TPA: hypothetical protein VJ901_18390 [Thermoanaerobaculia bacterium]|nr:hypothetical protein [Thermoanaerobaculia bacterium]